MSEQRLLLVDGNSLVFRAYYATMGRRMTNREGKPTNALYGFISMLGKALDTFSPTHVLVAFDAGKKTFRNNLFTDYKGTRKSAPEDLVAQFPLIRAYLAAYPMVYHEQEGFEADDIIGTLVRMYPDMPKQILTGDRDLLQLVNETTTCTLMKKGISEMITYDLNGFTDEYEFVPSGIVDLKALMGDTADNIPGVRGVGEKTALDLIRRFGSLSGVYAHIDALKGKLKERLINDQEMAQLSKTLATIRQDVPLDLAIDTCLLHSDATTQSAFLRKYDLDHLLERVTPTETAETLQVPLVAVDAHFLSPDVFVHVVEKQKQITHFYIGDRQSVGVLTAQEATNSKVFQSLLAGDFQFATDDLKGLIHFAHQHGLQVHDGVDDLLVMAFVSNSLLGTLEKVRDHYQLRDERYHGADEAAWLTQRLYRLMPVLRRQLELQKQLSLYEGIERPLIDVLADMEEVGMRVDLQVLQEIAKKTEQKLDELSSTIYTLSHETFNINSPKQLAVVLFDHLNLGSGKKRSTAVEALEAIKNQHPVIEHILAYRKYQKIYSTYAQGLQKYVVDGKIHTTFNQTIAQTGRLSSSDPNLQNLSVRDSEARQIRKAFIAQQGHVLVSMDYSQIELRVLAHLAQEPAMIEAFRKEADIHAATAADLFGVPLDAVDDVQRRMAKTVNFGIIYGISEYGLAQQLDITPAHAKQIITTYLDRYPRIQAYMDQVVADCEQNGYVTTMFGRRREIPEIHDKNYAVRAFGKRAAMNAPIQGSAADLIKKAMIDVAHVLRQHKAETRMVMQVHDELIFDMPISEQATLTPLLQQAMEQTVQLSVPLHASVQAGKNWYEAKIAMPELPEVETVVRTLEHQLLQSQIQSVLWQAPHLFVQGYSPQVLVGEHLRQFARRGKYLVLTTDHYRWVIHLRMEGRFAIHTHAPRRGRHDHFIVSFEDGRQLWFQDVRKFGTMEILDLHDDYFARHLLGPEPFDPQLTAEGLRLRLKKHRMPLKTALMDQKILAGLGNIYADEVLFLSGIHPLKRSDTLSRAQSERLLKAIREVLTQAIAMGGSTVRSFRSEGHVSGLFQQQLHVYGRQGKVCHRCGQELVRLVIGGRSSVYCPHCQTRR